MDTDPKITVHIPVYNGENYLEIAIKSILDQTFQDFELIITDNCSTDNTREICERYAAQNSKIQYVIHPSNIGAAANFDSGVHLARGTYFKWAAHDDFHDPEFLQTCFDVIETDPEIVLVQSLVQIVDENGGNLDLYDSKLVGSDSDDPVERFKPMTHIRHVCTEMFGLYRLDALKKTKMLAPNYHACDRAMLAELSLVGKIKQIPRVLFYNREHNARYVRQVRPTDRMKYHQRETAKKKSMVDQMALYRDYKDAVRNHLSDPKDRKRARRLLTSWWFVEWNAVRLIVQIVSLRFPIVYDWAKWVSDRIIAPKHSTIITNKNAT